MDSPLKEFFNDWKKEDQKLTPPEFPEVPNRSRNRIWRLVAACAVVLTASTFLIQQQYSNYLQTQRQDSTATKGTVEETMTATNMYEWQSPTSSLASDF